MDGGLSQPVAREDQGTRDSDGSRRMACVGSGVGVVERERTPSAAFSYSLQGSSEDRVSVTRL